MANHEDAIYSRDSFDIISSRSSSAIYSEWEKLVSGKPIDVDAQIHAYLREHYPELNITAVPTASLPLLSFVNAGQATAELDTKTDSILRWRGFIPPAHRGAQGQLGDAVFFAKYHLKWSGEDFIMYTIGSGFSQLQYLLKEPGHDEDVLSHCAKTDALIKSAVTFLSGDANQFVYVFDQYWMKSKELWEEVQKSSWDKVILDPKMKTALTDISSTFFDSKEIYEKYGVPWKRGLIFAGPPGNGKTISIKALMKTLYNRKDPVPTLYVKHAPQTYHLSQVFLRARAMTPCLLVMEDIETIVTPATRSYFFNEVDGLTNNGGILMVASTNYLDRLDPGLSKRPSRFDRKFIFPLPSESERAMYAQFWQGKLAKTKSDIAFPNLLCPAMAKITDGFSFAYLQEAFVASLLSIARESEKLDSDNFGDLDHYGVAQDSDDLSKYKLWRVFEAEVKNLRENMGDQADSAESESHHAVSSSSRPAARQRQHNSHPALKGSPFAGSWTDGLPVREGSGAAAAHEPTALEMASQGIFKRQYIGEHAYEWRM